MENALFYKCLFYSNAFGWRVFAVLHLTVVSCFHVSLYSTEIILLRTYSCYYFGFRLHI